MFEEIYLKNTSSYDELHYLDFASTRYLGVLQNGIGFD